METNYDKIVKSINDRFAMCNDEVNREKEEAFSYLEVLEVEADGYDVDSVDTFWKRFYCR